MQMRWMAALNRPFGRKMRVERNQSNLLTVPNVKFKLKVLYGLVLKTTKTTKQRG